MSAERTSYSELATLADCEMKWRYRYLDRQRGDSSVALRKGTFVHEAAGRWWADETLTMEQVLLGMHDLTDLDDVRIDGSWIAKRYEQHWGPQRDSGELRMIGREVRFLFRIPGTTIDLLAYLDNIAIDTEGKLWLVERKTMYDWRRLESIYVDPQLSLYLWIAKAHGLPIVGVIFDAIRTYRWQPEKPTQGQLLPAVEAAHPDWAKKAQREEAKRLQGIHPGVERPFGESFDTRYIDHSDEHIENALGQARAGLVRRAMLQAGLPAVRNIGQSCRNCSHRTDCWDGLAFGESIEIDEDTE